MQQSKIDAVVNKAIDAIAKKGRGFTLDLAAEKREAVEEARRMVSAYIDASAADKADLQDEVRAALADAERALAGVSISVVEQLPPVDEWERPADLRRHTLGSTQAFIAYALRYAKPEDALVMINTEKAVLVIDEHVARGEREVVTLPWVTTTEFHEWGGVLNQTTVHKSLLKFVMLHAHTLVSPEVVARMRECRVSATVKNDSNIQQDEKELGIKVHMSSGEALVKFPREFKVKLPVLMQDIGDESAHVTVPVSLDIELPDQPTGPVEFMLYAPTWPTVLRERVLREMDVIRTELDGLVVVEGTHATARREIGRGHVNFPR